MAGKESEERIGRVAESQSTESRKTELAGSEVATGMKLLECRQHPSRDRSLVGWIDRHCAYAYAYPSPYSSSTLKNHPSSHTHTDTDIHLLGPFSTRFTSTFHAYFFLSLLFLLSDRFSEIFNFPKDLLVVYSHSLPTNWPLLPLNSKCFAECMGVCSDR